MTDYEIKNEQLDEESFGVKVIDDAMKLVKKYVDLKLYKAEKETFFGKVPCLMMRIKIQVPDMERWEDRDDGNPVKPYNCPPFIMASLSRNYIGCDIGTNGWCMIHSFVVRQSRVNYNGTPVGTYMEYHPYSKHESIINILTALRVAGVKEADEALRMVIFDGINRLFKLDVGQIELAGMEDEVKYCLETLNNTDERLVSRHLLLAGPPGCGKSETVKVLVKETPEWLHYALNKDINDWKTFMFNLNKLMKFLNKRMMIIVDEIDEIGLTREQSGSKKVYDLLRVMDGVDDLGHVKFVATTNRPAALDPALLRIGRFGPVIYIESPTDVKKEKIVAFYNKRYGGTVDASQLLICCTGAVGCDIRAAFEDCIIHHEEVNTDNVLKNIQHIIKAKDIEKKDYL